MPELSPCGSDEFSLWLSLEIKLELSCTVVAQKQESIKDCHHLVATFILTNATLILVILSKIAKGLSTTNLRGMPNCKQVKVQECLLILLFLEF